MKKIVLLLLLGFTLASARATNCMPRYFLAEHIALSTCHNHHRGSDQASIYYDGVVKALNDYITLKIKKGELQNRIMHISMYDPILSSPHYLLSQSNTSYFISTYGHRDLKELMILIDKFAEPNFIALELEAQDFSSRSKYKTKEEQEKGRDEKWNYYHAYEN